MTQGIHFIPDLMGKGKEQEILSALENFFTEHTKLAWPTAYNFLKKNGQQIPLEEIDLVVLPLDRIGAPQGMSGANVFIAYFSDNSKRRL